MEKPIYLEHQEEIISIVQKIKRSGTTDVLLVVPKGAKILKNLTSLKLLREQAARIGKRVAIATADEQGRVLVRRAGIRLELMQQTQRAVGDRVRMRGMGDISSSKKPPEKKAETNLEEPPVEVVPSLSGQEEELSELIGPEKRTDNIEIPETVKIPLSTYKYTILSSTAVIAALAVIFFYVLPSAAIIVTPRVESISRDQEILVDTQAATPDIQTLTIPGEKVTGEFTATKTYEVTGKKRVGEKASGFITMYNFSNNSLILRSETTRLEADGKIFYFVQDVGSIKPTTRSGPSFEVDPESLVDPIPIVAAEAGSDFNVPEGTRFEIFNEVFGHQPEILYAVNANPVSGGTDLDVPVLSEEDVAVARADIVGEFENILRTEIDKRPGTNSVLADRAISLQIVEESFSAAVGDEISSFEMSQRAQVEGLVYDKEHAKNLVIERIIRLLPDNKILLDDGRGLEAEFISLDLAGGAGTLQVHFNASLGFELQQDLLKRGLSGKTALEVKEILLARPEVDVVEVNLSPFWVKKVPRFESKVKLTIQRIQ